MLKMAQLSQQIRFEYLSADDEDRVMIAQSDEETDKNKMLTNDHIRARIKGDFPIVTPDMVQYTDVAPNQILSVAASLNSIFRA